MESAADTLRGALLFCEYLCRSIIPSANAAKFLASQLGWKMITSLLCLVFPLLLIYAAWHDVSTMTIPNWVSIILGIAFIPAAFAAGLSLEQIGMHLVFGAGVLILCAALFYLNVFGGGDAKVIAAASLWTGLAATAPFVMGMAIAGG
ncbi:MAG: hypothetical protein EON93_13720, partial [Burkholderiales bacterium]